MKDRPKPNTRPAALADFWRQGAVDQSLFGAGATDQGFHSKQSGVHDDRVALPVAALELRPTTLPPLNPDEEPTDAPDAYSTGEFSFPEPDEDDTACMTPPGAPGRGDLDGADELSGLDDLFTTSLSPNLGPAVAAAGAARVEVGEQAVTAAAPDDGADEGAAMLRGPAVARRMWRARVGKE